MHCQAEEIINPNEVVVEKSFKILNMEQICAGQRKALGIVTLEVISKPNSLSDSRLAEKSTIQVEYPIWDGDHHMPSLVVEHPSKNHINHTDSQKIAKEIEKLIKPIKGE